MSSQAPQYHKYLLHFSVVVILTLFLLLTPCGMVSAEKIPTSLSIEILPKDPSIDQSFRIIGTLKTTSGDILGNKRVILESTADNPGDESGYTFVAIKDTGRSGGFEFYRPKNTPPEYLRVRYGGNADYEPAISPFIAVRGVGTPNPQIRMNRTGTLTVSTNPSGADIYVDHLYKGLTPRSIGGLYEGPHNLDLGKPGFQNETIEVYISPDRDTSLGISLSREGSSSTGNRYLSSLSYIQNISEPLGDPDFSLDLSGFSINMYGNSTSSRKGVKTTTLISNDTVSGGYDIMVLMTDH